MQLKLLW